MSFNSWLFILFLIAVVALYRAMPSARSRNIVLLLASYVFYSAWDWRFLFLILISTFVDFAVGRALHTTQSNQQRKRLLAISLVANLGMLGFFKYFNFFVAGFGNLLEVVGFSVSPLALNIILPVGISFFTFQTMSYTIDVYRRRIPTEFSLLNFAVFVAMFPQLVAGPIERAANLLPQIAKADKNACRFDEAISLILWGLFKKVVVADNLAIHADRVFSNSATVSATEAYLGTLAFAIQIYADFSAYSDIARGCAKLLGLELMVNFRNPYLALNPQDFWRRWHISLSTWLRDYLYIGLGGNRNGELRTYRNLAITMLLGGMWHGASWNFLWWGAFHGFLLAAHRYFSEKSWLPAIPRPVSWALMFHLTLFGWLLFRCAETAIIDGVYFDNSGQQLWNMLTSVGREATEYSNSTGILMALLLFATPMFVTEYLQHRSQSVIPYFRSSRVLAGLVCGVLAFFYIRYGVQAASSFIYFQF